MNKVKNMSFRQNSKERRGIANKILIVLFLILHLSCKKSIKYSHKILLNNKLNTDLFKTIKTPEKALLCGYLFTYGNECDAISDKIKCKILEVLKIEDECNPKHIAFLKKWFKNEVIMSLKLQKCPVLPRKFAIQNTIKKIVISRNLDTISITINVIGMNTSQEKNWNIEQTESFIIKNNSFIKIAKNANNKS